MQGRSRVETYPASDSGPCRVGTSTVESRPFLRVRSMFSWILMRSCEPEALGSGEALPCVTLLCYRSRVRPSFVVWITSPFFGRGAARARGWVTTLHGHWPTPLNFCWASRTATPEGLTTRRSLSSHSALVQAEPPPTVVSEVRPLAPVGRELRLYKPAQVRFISLRRYADAPPTPTLPSRIRLHHHSVLVASSRPTVVRIEARV